MTQSLTGLWKELKPLVQIEINKANRNGGATSLAGSPSVGVATHALYGSAHSGTLDPSQAPWVATDISTAIANHNATSDPHANYMHIATARTVTAIHSLNNGVTSTDADSEWWQGRALVGYVGHADYAGFAHRDCATTGGYAVLQGAFGATLFNAPAGQAIYHRINNSDVMIMDAARLNPSGSILKDLGDYNRKWRTLFAAELYVETLVAQSVLATIGGRIMVAPTVKLIADINTSQTTIDTDYSSLLNGDYVYMATAPGGLAQIEVMKITSSATAITGGYRYNVIRALDGTPANSWVAGDAMVSLGNAVGKGYIELTSTSTIHNHLGPTVAIYTRTGTAAWNQVAPTVAMGNLRSFVDYSSDEMGFAVGNDLTLAPASGFKGSTNDRTNGLRMFNVGIKEYQSGTLFLTLDTSGLEFSGVDQSYARVRWLTSGETAEIGTHTYGDSYKRMDLRSWAATKSAVRIGAWNSGQVNSPVAYIEVRQDVYATEAYIIADEVGIGTTTPTAKLDVARGTSTDGTAVLRGTTIPSHFNYSTNEDTYIRGGKTASQVLIGDANTGNVRLAEGGGNVGINVGAPEAKLHVAGAIRARSSGGGYVTMHPGDSSNVGYLEWYRDTGARIAYLGHGGETNLTLALESSANLYLTGGQLWVGNSTDIGFGAKIQTDGNIWASGAITSASYWQVAAASVPAAASGYCRVTLRSSDNALVAVMPSGNVRVLATN